jgi:hypothetical protein
LRVVPAAEIGDELKAQDNLGEELKAERSPRVGWHFGAVAPYQLVDFTMRNVQKL